MAALHVAINLLQTNGKYPKYGIPTLIPRDCFCLMKPNYSHAVSYEDKVGRAIKQLECSSRFPKEVVEPKGLILK